MYIFKEEISNEPVNNIKTIIIDDIIIIIFIMGSSAGGIMERFRRKPIIFFLGVTVVLFYVTPFYYPRSSYLAFPVICKNASCQQAVSAVAGMALSLWEEESHPNYVVYGPNCKIMDMDPFEKSVKRFWKMGKPKKCTDNFSKLEKQRLTLNEKVTKTWKMKNVKCCYRSIHRVNQNPDKYNKNCDWEFKYSGTCHTIPNNNEGTIVNDSFIKVECKGSGKPEATVEFQGTALPPKILSEATKKKAEYWDERKNQGYFNDPPSIFIVGIDSISRMHMMRSLPKTKAFLQKSDFIELKGYNKVGENTFPNIMAGFGGMGLDHYKPCWPNNTVKLDDCPFVWKNFSDLNYMTAFLEDVPGIAIFNYAKLGFVLPPADYYSRPLSVAMHKLYKWGRSSAKASCVGGQSPTDFQANYIKEFVLNMRKDYPYFMFSWFTAIGHDDFNGLKTADDTFLNLFKVAMNNESANPDNTIMIFMSDHGYRFGSFRETFLGFYEESLPFFFFRMSPSLKERYPEWYANLKRNSGQLTSPLDLHNTLKQILYEANSEIMASGTSEPSEVLSISNSFNSTTTTEPQQLQHSKSFIEGIQSLLGLADDKDKGQQNNGDQQHENLLMNPHNLSASQYYYYNTAADNITNSDPLNPQYRQRYSFFEYIPNNRTCESSSIPQRYCMCGVSPVMSKTSSLSSHMGDIVVSHVNYMLESVINSGECATLKFTKFLYGREVGHGEIWNNFHQFINYKDYLVALEAGPSKAHFESKIRIFQNSTERILGDITRVNSYKGQSDCVSDSKLRPFCFCEKKGKDKKNKDKHGKSHNHATKNQSSTLSSHSIFSAFLQQNRLITTNPPPTSKLITTLTVKSTNTNTTTTNSSTQGNNQTVSTNRHIDKISSIGKPK